MLHRRRFAEKLTLGLAVFLCVILIILSFRHNNHEKRVPQIEAKVFNLREQEFKVNYTRVSIRPPYPSFFKDVHVHYKTNDPKEGFFKKPRIFTFLKHFRNPCFFENECGCKTMEMKLRCLPYFHIVGFPKSGSTDLWAQLLVHPDIINLKKESNYWAYGRYAGYAKKLKSMKSEGSFKSNFTIGTVIPYCGELHSSAENASLSFCQPVEFGLNEWHETESEKIFQPLQMKPKGFLNDTWIMNFGKSTQFNNHVEDQQKHRDLNHYIDRMKNGSKALLKELFHSNGQKVNKIFGEGSVTYAYSSLGLRSAIGSLTSKPPEEVDADVGQVLKWFTPDAKIIFSLRNPVDRLYSDYRNLFNGLLSTEKSKENFHSIVEDRIEKWKQCIKTYTQEYCVASPMFEVIAVHTPVIGLVRGMYSIFIRKWLKSFKMEQMHFIRLEDRLQGVDALQETFKFLDIRPLDAHEITLLDVKMKMKKSRYPSKLKKHQVGQGEPMLEKTRKLLEEFYKPFNEDLAELLDDPRYLWSNG